MSGCVSQKRRNRVATQRFNVASTVIDMDPDLQSRSVLPTNAIVLLSGDHDGTLMVP
jgi:hypothetical protein